MVMVFVIITYMLLHIYVSKPVIALKGLGNGSSVHSHLIIFLPCHHFLTLIIKNIFFSIL